MIPPPGVFGGTCLVGQCSFGAELLLPSSTYFGLPKSGSYFYGTWRDPDGNLLRALRGVGAGASAFALVFVSDDHGPLRVDATAADELWRGDVTVERAGESVAFRSPDGERFTYGHEPERCSWLERGLLEVSGRSIGPGVQWFNTWAGGACYAVTGKYRSSGTFLGRPVEGFTGHEIHYWPPGSSWRDSPYGRGREICWQQIANEYDDGSIVQASFAYGAGGWGFAMVHDETGRFHCTTEVCAEATVRPNGYPDTITYRFLDQSWTWRIDPQGERPVLTPGHMLGADGTCRRDGDARRVRWSMGNSDWWTDGRADPIVRVNRRR
jgi:hypothetical protein